MCELLNLIKRLTSALSISNTVSFFLARSIILSENRLSNMKTDADCATDKQLH